MDAIAELVNVLHARIGRNLLRYQSIEISFKAAAPFLTKNGQGNDWASVNASRERLSGLTMGLLFRELGPLLDIPQDYLDTGYEEIAAARNELVHHFMEPGRRDLATEPGLEAAIAHLDQQYEQAGEIARLAASLNMAVLVTRVRAMPGRDQELELLSQQLIERIPEDFEVINQNDPTRTLWGTTRVVRLLKRAERETKPFQGVTLLHLAGQFIRTNDPALDYRDYGLEKLSHIVDVSGLFEMFKLTSPDGGVSHVAYRSK